MITKTGKQLVKSGTLEKNAIDPISIALGTSKLLAAAGAGHVAQNAVGSAVIKNPKKYGLLQMIMRGIARPEKGMSTLGGNVAYGAAEGVMPEIGMIYEKASRLGKHLENVLAKQNLTMDKLPRRHATVLSLAGQGRFRDAYRVANTPETRDLLNSYMSKIMPGIEHLMGSVPALEGQAGTRALAALRKEIPERVLTRDNINNVLENLEKAYQEGPLGQQISQTLKSDGSTMLANALKGEDTFINKWARKGVRTVTRAGLFFEEPGMAALNESKRFLDWQGARKVPGVAKIQDWGAKKFVTDPLQENFQKGLQGVDAVRYSRAGKKEAVNAVHRLEGIKAAKRVAKEYNAEWRDRYFLNSFSNEFNHMANKAGLALHNAGFTPEHLDKLKGIGDKVRRMWGAYYDQAVGARQVAKQLEQETKQKALQEAAFKRNQEYVNKNLKYQRSGMPVLDDEKQRLLGDALYDIRPLGVRIRDRFKK